MSGAVGVVSRAVVIQPGRVMCAAGRARALPLAQRCCRRARAADCGSRPPHPQRQTRGERRSERRPGAELARSRMWPNPRAPPPCEYQARPRQRRGGRQCAADVAAAVCARHWRHSDCAGLSPSTATEVVDPHPPLPKPQQHTNTQDARVRIAENKGHATSTAASTSHAFWTRFSLSHPGLKSALL